MIVLFRLEASCPTSIALFSWASKTEGLVVGPHGNPAVAEAESVKDSICRPGRGYGRTTFINHWKKAGLEIKGSGRDGSRRTLDAYALADSPDAI